MSGPAAILRELHRLRRFTKDLQDEIDRLPRQLKGQQDKVARAEAALKEGQDKVAHLKVESREKDVTFKATQEQIVKHEDQRNRAGSKKEYDGLNLEIANAKKALARLEEEFLVGLTDIEERSALLPDLEKTLKVAREELARLEASGKERRTSLVSQLEKAQQDLKEVEATLPPDIKIAYDRQVQARGEDAMAAVQDRVCVACYTSITAQSHNELLQGLFVPCKSCGRILYMPE